MAGAPPVEFCVDRHGIWRAGVGCLVVASCAALFAWWWGQPAPVPLWASVAALAGCAAAVGFGVALVRQPRTTLRWDRRQWSLEVDAAPPWRGELTVAIDLGSWMLLRFAPGEGPRPALGSRGVRWIAVQRRGLEAHWHTLRCTVHAPRPPDSDGR